VTGDTGVLKKPATLAVILTVTVATHTIASIGNIMGQVINIVWLRGTRSAALTSNSAAMTMSAVLVGASRRGSGSFASPVQVDRSHLIRMIFDLELMLIDL
jgi:hypothetical protein